MKGSLPILVVALAFCLVATISYLVAARQYEREAALPVQTPVQLAPAKVVTPIPPTAPVKAPALVVPAGNEVVVPAPPSVPVVQADDAAQVAEDAAAVGMTTVEPDPPAAVSADPHALDATEELPLS